MYQYRVKVPTFLLGCLLAAALVNFVSDLRIRMKAEQLPATLAVTETTAAYDARLAMVADPAELRALASREHQHVLAADPMVMALVGLVKTAYKSLLIQSGAMLGLLVFYYLAEYRRPH